ncbi:RasGTPase-activating protein [Dictyostelium discoideum AX4]|uniref:RasGTPase-activating protein n=1 Tax=Dictyostelium discoideum TaxID=44689 RepID=Q86JJ7_DICDI|nr:RasGTPase-activating protein [Dictyostelium discoideum AX4]EAL68595.1 RasGTPase-activating protein [Dictyostelium discoideum AX4]|eukprot:XP_642526.1 RasGTPase-activating protein [Dictyostelium discoideum AX4]
MSKFTNLLRKSSSMNMTGGTAGDRSSVYIDTSGNGNSGGSSPDTSIINTPFGEAINEKVIEPSEIKLSEKNLNDIKVLLNDIIKSCKNYYDRGEQFAKTQVKWSQSFSKDYEKSTTHSSSAQQVYQQQQQAAAANGNGETSTSDSNLGFIRALEQFTSSITKTSGFESEWINSVMEGLIKPIQILIGAIDEKKQYRKKFDKAVQEYENIISKIKHQQTQKKIDILKIYNYEKEKSKLKQNYENVKNEYIYYLTDTENRMHTEFLDLLVLHYESMQLLNGNAYAEYAGIKTYIDSLRTWCLNEQDYFQKESIERDARRVLELQKEEDLKHQPIIDLLVSPPFYLWKLLSEIRKNELFPPPPPPNTPIVVPPPPIHFIPNLVRIFEARGQLSELLIMMVQSDLPNISMTGTFLPYDIVSCEFIEEIANLPSSTPYLKYLFDQSITNIINYHDNYRINTQQGITNLIAEFEYVLNIFQGSCEYLPPPFKKASIEIQNGLNKLSPGSKSPPIGCLLFSRVFAPVVARPHQHQLFHVIPSDQALEVLAFLSTMFVNFGTNQSFMASILGSQQLNESMDAWKPVITTFFDQVKQSDLTEWDSSITLNEVYQQDIPVIQSFIKRHYLHISGSYLSRDREQLSVFTHALGSLEADDPPPTEKQSNNNNNSSKHSSSSSTPTQHPSSPALSPHSSLQNLNISANSGDENIEQ